MLILFVFNIANMAITSMFFSLEKLIPVWVGICTGKSSFNVVKSMETTYQIGQFRTGSCVVYIF